MKCDCKTCRGTGEIECPDCNGSGGDYRPLSGEALDPSHPYYDQLKELQADAMRVEKQFRELAARNPAREESYRGQFSATIRKIERQAEKVTEGGKK